MLMMGWGMVGELFCGLEKLGWIVYCLEWRWGLGKCGVGGDLIGDVLVLGIMIFFYVLGENIVVLKCCVV